jgi:hypothetical protein
LFCLLISSYLLLFLILFLVIIFLSDGPGRCRQWRGGQETATMIVVFTELEESLTGQIIVTSGEVVRKLQQ